MENFNIHDLHGSYFTAEICFTDVVGRISVNENGFVYLCQDAIDGGSRDCRDFFGHKYGVYAGGMGGIDHAVQNLKILPSPIEYHELFKLILEHRESTWDVDGNYSVLPKDVMAKISDFMDGIKIL